jgi:PEP-CTERM motif
MHGYRHTLLRALGASLVLVALVVFTPTVSHAHEHDADFARAPRHRTDHHKYHVPEPSPDALLVVGLGVIGLVSYGVQRRQQAA